jgi:glycosyltransferase involved in cell wall biosynthesis
MPAGWRARPDARVLLVGEGPGRQIRRLGKDARVTVTGSVPDVAPFLARATLAVCPMRYGVGIQNKVLEAMAAGLPVVVTRTATTALSAEPGRDLVVVDSMQDGAAEILRLLGSPEARGALSRHGREYVERHHDPVALGARLVAALSAALAPTGTGPP